MHAPDSEMTSNWIIASISRDDQRKFEAEFGSDKDKKIYIRTGWEKIARR